MADFASGFHLMEAIDQLLPAEANHLANIPAPSPPTPPKASAGDLDYVYNLLEEHFPDEATRADLQKFFCHTVRLNTRSSFVHYAKFVLQDKNSAILKHYVAHFPDDPASTFVRATIEELFKSHLQSPRVSSVVPDTKTIKPEVTQILRTQSASADQRKRWSELLYKYCMKMENENAPMHSFLTQYCFDGNAFKRSIPVLVAPDQSLKVGCPRCATDIQVRDSVSPYTKHIRQHLPSTKRSGDDESSGTQMQTKLKIARVSSPLTTLPPPLEIVPTSDSSLASTEVCPSEIEDSLLTH
jgi:hypothetical protein